MTKATDFVRCISASEIHAVRSVTNGAHCMYVQNDCSYLQAMAHPSMDSPVRHLEAQGVMLNVFNQLQGVDDLVICSCVSKTWNSLIREARPISLMIGGSAHFPELDAEGAACVLRWLQEKQRAGHLQNLREFWLFSEALFREEYESIRLQSAFFEAAIMCTGFWSLQSCTLEGPFCMEQAVALLPAALKLLDLRPTAPPAHIDLSACERFPKLQLLQVGGTPPIAMAADGPPSSIYWNGNLPALRSLKAYEPFVVMVFEEDDDEDNNENQWALPCLVQLDVCVLADGRGIALANCFINLKGLSELELCVLEGPDRQVVLKVLPTSSLSMLRLVGPQRHTEVCLEIYKKTLEYECRRITSVFMPQSSRCLSKLQII